MTSDPFLTVKQLADREGISERRVRLLLKDGLPHYRVRGIRIRLSEYTAWLQTKRGN